MSICPQCGHENSGDSAHCTKCGKQLLASCNMCNRRLQPDNTHCPECGTEVLPGEVFLMRITGIGISGEFGNEACIIGFSDKRILIVSNKNGIAQYATAPLSDVCKVKFKASIVHATKGTYAVSFMIASKRAKYGFVSNDGKKFAERLLKTIKANRKASRVQHVSSSSKVNSGASQRSTPSSHAKPAKDVDELIPALMFLCLFVPFAGIIIWLSEKDKYPKKARNALLIGFLCFFLMAIGPCRGLSSNQRNTGQTSSTETQSSFIHEVIDEEVYDIPVKTQVERNILITGQVSHDQLDAFLAEQYEEVLSSTGYEYREHPNAIYIYVYTPGSSGDEWIGRVEKHAASNTPTIYNQIPEGATVHSSTFSTYRQSLMEQVSESEDDDDDDLEVVSTRVYDDSRRFTESGEVITDSFTGLQWRIGPDRDTSFSGAVDWVSSLGGSWRMPTITELSELYQAGIVDDDEGLIWSDMFFNTGCWVWSSDCSDNTSARGVYFWGGDVMDYSRSFSMDGRVFAVR